MNVLELNIKNIFLLIRPYSIMSIISIAILTSIFVSGKFIWNKLTIESIIVSVLIWISMVFFLEFMHKHIDNRRRIPDLILFGSILAVVFLLANYIATLVVFLITFFSVYLYSLKSKNWIFSPIVFIFRGFVEVGMIVIILMLNNANPFSSQYLNNLILPIFFITISRNLVGDIRDVDRDKYTFPKKFGETMAFAFSLVFLIMGALFIQNIVIIFPLIPIVLMLLTKKNGYTTHSLYIICTLFFLVSYISVLLKQELLTVFLLFAGTLLWMTYDSVPRKVNKDLTSIQ